MNNEIDETQIQYHMSVAKAMFMEHARLRGIDPEMAEGAWMLEEDVRHYWTHLAVTGLDEMVAQNQQRLIASAQTPSVPVYAALMEVLPDGELNCLAIGDELSAIDYAALLLLKDESLHLFLVPLGADGNPIP